MTNTNNETNYIDPIDAYLELRDSMKTSSIYKEALRKAAAAALDNYESTWETPDQPWTFPEHVVDCGPCPALEAVREWATRHDYTLEEYLSDYLYMAEEG